MRQVLGDDRLHARPHPSLLFGRQRAQVAAGEGGLDMGIVGHEYTHAITNRMVGGPDEGLTSDEETEIEQHLRGLGYVE